MTRFIKAIHIGSNVTDVMKLPCVEGCFKTNDKCGLEWLMYRVRIGRHIELVEEGDWLCKDDTGRWHAMDDEMYNALTKKD